MSPLLLTRVVKWGMSIGALTVAGWFAVDFIGDAREAALTNLLLKNAMEVDAREDQKTNQVTYDNEQKILMLESANETLARLVPQNIKVGACWSTPLSPDFVRVYKSNYGKGIQAFAADTSKSNTISNPMAGVSYGQALLMYDLALKSCNTDKSSMKMLTDSEKK